jgi:DNA-binding FadR family transcriptional regulator
MNMASRVQHEFPLEQAPRRKLAETVAQQLLDAVRTLEPGTRIPSEKELTQMLGVGRSTVREALNGLALLGSVEIRHGQGVFVAPPATLEASSAEPGTIVGALTKGVTHDLLEARQIVEVAIARLAAQRRTEIELQEMEAVLNAHRDAIVRVQSPAKHGMQFHVLLAQAAHNEVLEGVFHSFMKLMFSRGPRLYQDVHGFAAWELDQHQRLYEAIRDGDADAAAERMSAHVGSMAEHYRAVGEA